LGGKSGKRIHLLPPGKRERGKKVFYIVKKEGRATGKKRKSPALFLLKKEGGEKKKRRGKLTFPFLSEREDTSGVYLF